MLLRFLEEMEPCFVCGEGSFFSQGQPCCIYRIYPVVWRHTYVPRKVDHERGSKTIKPLYKSVLRLMVLFLLRKDSVS
jgi:hypothetical protein